MSELLDKLTNVDNWIFYQDETNGFGTFCADVNIPEAAKELSDLRARLKEKLDREEKLTVAMWDDQKDNAAWKNTEDNPYQKGYYTGRRDEAMSVLNALSAYSQEAK